MRHNSLIILIIILLIGQVNFVSAEFNIGNNEPIIKPDLINPNKIKNILPESMQNIINDAENLGIDVVKQGVDIATGEKSLNINSSWWQNIKSAAKNIWDKINEKVDIDTYFSKAKDVVLSLIKILWDFFKGIFSDNRMISQPRA